MVLKCGFVLSDTVYGVLKAVFKKTETNEKAIENFVNYISFLIKCYRRPPLWSSGQSF
jgi:hypothetical protein